MSGQGNHVRYRLRLRAGALAIVALAAAVAIPLGLLAPRPVVASSAGVTVSILAAPGCSVHSTARGTYCLKPSAVTTPSGGTVTWQNKTGTAQTLTRCSAASCGNDGGTGGDSPFPTSSQRVNPHESYSFTFSGVGTYYYDCSDLAQMCGVGLVTVTAAATPAPSPVQLSLGPVTAPSSTPTPAPTPSPTPTPSDTPPAVAVATPSSDTPPTPASLPLATDSNGNPGSGPPLVIIVLIILTLVAIGGGVLSFRLFRQ